MTLRVSVVVDGRADGADRALGKTADDLDAVTRKARQAAAAGEQIGPRVVPALTRVNGSTANIAAQFQDIAVQLAAGQSPFTIALQQGTQLSAALGEGRGLAGTLTALIGGFASLLSPVSLLTIGMIAVGGAALQFFTTLQDKGLSAEERLKAHKEWLDKILTGYDAAKAGAEKYIQEAKQTPIGVVGLDLTAAQDQLATQRATMDEQMVRVRERVQETLALLQQYRDSADAMGGDTALLDGTLKQVEAIHNLGLNSKSTASAVTSAMEAVRAFQNSADDPSVQQMAADVYDMLNAMRGAAGQAQSLAAGIAAIAAQQKGHPFNAGAADALSGLQKLGQPQLDDRGQALKTRNEGLAGTVDTIQRTSIINAYNEAIARIATREAEEKALQRTKEATAAGERQATQYKSVVDALALQTQEVGLSAREQEKLNQIKAAGVAINSAEADTIRKSVDALYDKRSANDALAASQKRVADTLQEINSVGRSLTEGAMATLLGDLRQGQTLWQSIGNAGIHALNSIADKAAQMAADGIWNMIFNAVTAGVTGGSGAGTLASVALGALAGARADGGPVTAGKAYLVGEKRPEIFVPGSSGTILPSTGGAGGFTFAPNVMIDLRGSTVNEAMVTAEVNRGLAAMAKTLPDRFAAYLRDPRLRAST